MFSNNPEKKVELEEGLQTQKPANDGCVYSAEEYQKIEDFLQKNPDGRYEKKIQGKKRSENSSTAIENIFQEKKALASILKIDGEVYAIGEKLGQGSYGKVKVITNKDNSKLAIKTSETVLESNEEKEKRSTLAGKVRLIKRHKANESYVSNEFLQRMVEREAEVMEKLGRGKRKVFERKINRFDKQKIQYTLVMDYFTSIALNEYIFTSNHLQTSLSEKVKIALDICEELAKLHQAGFFHGDLKPANILINPQTKQLRLIDFGSATRINSDERRTWTQGIADPTSITRSTSASEVYELGVTLMLLFGFGSIKNEIVTKLEWNDKPTNDSDTSIYDFIKNEMMNLDAKARPSLTDVKEILTSYILPLGNSNCNNVKF